MSGGALPALDAAFRAAVWRAQGASEDQAAELVAYGHSPVQDGPLARQEIPLPEPMCVAAWEGYAAAAARGAAWEALRGALMQLRFPIRAGMSQDADYLAGVRRGVWPDESRPGVVPARPEGLRVFLHATPAGRVPVVLAEAREDFEALVQAITRRNEPEAIPPTMGACMLAGYNNWGRVEALKRAHAEAYPEDHDGSGWAQAFAAIVPQKDLYQDRFMLLSSGPYSGTRASDFGLDEAEWRARSVKLRLEHECTHYFMRQAFGAMRKSLLDELVADYMGLVEAMGAFSSAFFLRFMGLEAYPPYREGGRLQNYRGSLSDGAFAALMPVVKRAAETLARLDPSRGRAPLGVHDKARLVTALTRVGLEGLASDQAEARLSAALSEAASAIPGD